MRSTCHRTYRIQFAERFVFTGLFVLVLLLTLVVGAIPLFRGDKIVEVLLAVSVFTCVLFAPQCLHLHRYRFCISEFKIRQVSWFRSKTLANESVHELEWQPSSDKRRGAVSIRGINGTIKVALAGFSEDERREIIEILHDRFADIPQTNWNEFQQSVPASNSIVRLAPLGFIAFAAVFFVAWISGLGGHNLGLAAGNLLVGLWLLLSSGSKVE